jgi:DNA-binding NarL/FixJ family response regulator
LHEIRILLVNLPRLLREIVRTVVASQLDLCVIADVTGDDTQLAAVLDAVVADVVILNTDHPESATLLSPLLAVRPPVRIVVIANDGRESFVCQPSGELSPASLLDAIRHPLGYRPDR